MKRIFCVLLAVTVCVCFCSADDLYRRQYDALELDKLENSKIRGAEDIELSRDISFNDGLAKIFEDVVGNIGTVFCSSLKCLFVIVSVSVIASIAESLCMQGESGTIKNCISLVSAIAVTTAASGNILSMIGMGKELIENVNVFSKALLPTIAAAEAACGTASSAVAKASATVLFSDILITLINYVLLPLTYLNVFVATAHAAAENNSLRRISDITVKTVIGILKFLVSAFVAYITVVGIVSGDVDKAGLKTAQYALGGGIPIVGGIISDAAETVIAGAMLMKNVIGVFGMLVVLAACAMPIITIAINYFMFKFAAIFASPVVGAGVAELSDRLAQSFGMVLAMCASCVLMIFISIVVSMQSVGVL